MERWFCLLDREITPFSKENAISYYIELKYNKMTEIVSVKAERRGGRLQFAES